MILLIFTWNWPFMEEQKNTAGKGAERGAIIVLFDYCIFIIIGGLNQIWISINCTAQLLSMIDIRIYFDLKSYYFSNQWNHN